MGHYLFWEHKFSLEFLILKHSARKFPLVPLRMRVLQDIFDKFLGCIQIHSNICLASLPLLTLFSISFLDKLSNRKNCNTL